MITNTNTILDTPLFNQLKSSKTYISKSDKTSGNKYLITITKEFEFDSKYENPTWTPLKTPVTVSFEYNDNYLNESTLIDWLNSWDLDAETGRNIRDVGDLIENFGYTISNRAEYLDMCEIYESCIKARNDWKKFFNPEEIKELQKWLHENM